MVSFGKAMSKKAAVQIEERRNKKENHEIESSSGNDADMEYFPENENSNSQSEYFEAILRPATITEQPHPQKILFKNAKISASSKSGETANNHLSISKHKALLRVKSLKKLYIRQHSNAINTFLGFLQNNRYVVQDVNGNVIYHVFEISNNMCQCDCRTAKYSQLHFTTSTGQELIKMEKLLTCSNFFCGRFGNHPVNCILSGNQSHQLIIESPPGVVIGSVIQQISLIKPHYQVVDLKGNPKYFIIGSTNNFSCFTCCCCDIQYEVLSADKNILIGIIIKELAEKSDKITTVDNFNISC